jgi:hypothetical protein
MPGYRKAWGVSIRRLAGCAATLALVFVLAACSTPGAGSGGADFSLGLAGSTADHPSQPPQIAATGPGGTYAFVYDNQIWVHTAGQAGAKQLTHVVLSNGANITWGPLVWSPNGNEIAFALVQDLTPSSPSRVSGPILFVNAAGGGSCGDGSAGTTCNTGATGSAYGHTYAWFTDKTLIYTTGGGIMLYDLGDTQYQRVWQVLTPVTTLIGGGTTSYYSSGNTGFGDVAVTTTGNLYFTQYTLSRLGAVGQIGSASLHEYSLQALSDYVDLPPDDGLVPYTLANTLPLKRLQDQGVNVDLGIAYTDAAGNVVTGAWQISPRGGTLAVQHFDGVDTKAGVVTSHFVSCTIDFSCSPTLQAAGKQPITAHGAMSVSHDGQRIAYSSDALYVQNVDGGGAAKLAGAGWITAPAWSPDGRAAVVTQLVSASTDAAGVRRNVTNAVTFDGKASTALIAGAQDVSWRY